MRNEKSDTERLIYRKMYEFNESEEPYISGLRAIELIRFIKTYRFLCDQVFGVDYNPDSWYSYTLKLEGELIEVTSIQGIKKTLNVTDLNNLSTSQLSSFEEMYATFCAIPPLEYFEEQWEYFAAYFNPSNVADFSIRCSYKNITVIFNGNTSLRDPFFEEITTAWTEYLKIK